MDSTADGGGSQGPSERDVGIRCHKTKSKCLVQHCHASKEERQWLTFLHQLLMLEHSYKEGFLPITLKTRGTRELSRHWPLFLPGSEIQILADQDGQGVEAVHCFHHW